MSSQPDNIKIALLEQEITQISNLFGKLDITIDKITDVSNHITKMLAVHEQKINQVAEDTEDVFHLVEKRRIEMDENIKELHSRITTGNREMTKEMSDAFISVHEAISKIEDKMDLRENYLVRARKELEDRISVLERWRWLTIGGAGVIGFLFGNLERFMLLFS
jgi:type I site-specific restriction-modification system R (restriction) subunit